MKEKPYHVILREAAKEAGLKIYKGYPCKYLHESGRYVSNNICVECSILSVTSYQRTDKGKEVKKYSDRKYYNSNKDRWLLWKQDNPDKVKEYKRVEYQNNKAAYIARARNREAHIKQATPLWYGEWEEFVHKALHEKRILMEKLTGFKWHIDHIVPLQNELVCGLHCIDNFRLIPASENLSKHNTFHIQEHKMTQR